MSTYARAWLVQGIWTICLVAILATFAMQTLGIAPHIRMVLGAIGFGGYIVMVLVASHLPRCPNCTEPVNLRADDKVRERQGLEVFHPVIPKRRCDFCGQNLTSGA